jgi:hypothetical protein
LGFAAAFDLRIGSLLSRERNRSGFKLDSKRQ